MRFCNSVLLLAALGVGMCMVGRAHAEMIIDAFSQPGDGSVFCAPGHTSFHPMSMTVTSNQSYSRTDPWGQNPHGFGQRTLTAELVGYDPFPFNAVTGWMPDGEMHVATFGRQGVRLHLDYSLNEGSAMDLTEGGSNTMFVLRFSSIDPGNDDSMRLVATVFSGNTEVQYATDLAEAITMSTYELRFQDFALTGSSGNPSGDPLDVFKNADRMHFSFNANANPNVDFAMLSIVSVPEPSGALLGLSAVLALAGFGYRPRRRSARR